MCKYLTCTIAWFYIHIYNSHMYIHTCVYIYICHVMPCDVMWCSVMSCRAMWCDALLCHVMSCHVMGCSVMSCHVMSCTYVYTYTLYHPTLFNGFIKTWLCPQIQVVYLHHCNHNFGMRSISGHIQMNSVQNLAILCWLVNQGFHSGTKKPGVKLSTMWVLFVGYCWFMLVYNHYEALRYIYHNTMH